MINLEITQNQLSWTVLVLSFNHDACCSLISKILSNNNQMTKIKACQKQKTKTAKKKNSLSETRHDQISINR